MKPTRRPANPCFSSGPCAKRPGWSPAVLANALVGRSHRSGVGLARLVEVIDRSRTILGIPPEWRVGIVAGSDTGAIEMAMWSLLGARGVDVLAWENFGEGWVADIAQLKLSDVRVMQAPYGKLPELSQVDPERDVVFVWNGTTSGVRVPNGDWIAADRRALAICDATSAVFAMRLPWDKLDVVTWSWQKSLGGEGGHGMLALSPRAVERFESYTPPWPLPKLFRLTTKAKLIEGVFRGETINTPSMLCVEDALNFFEMGAGGGWSRRAYRPFGTQFGGARQLGRGVPLGRFPRRRSSHYLLYFPTVQNHRSLVHTLFAGGSLSDRPGDDPASRTGGCGIRYRQPPRFAARSAHLDRAHGGDGRCGGAAALARMGLGRAAPDCQGRLRPAAQPKKDAGREPQLRTRASGREALTISLACLCLSNALASNSRSIACRRY